MFGQTSGFCVIQGPVNWGFKGFRVEGVGLRLGNQAWGEGSFLRSVVPEAST